MDTRARRAGAGGMLAMAVLAAGTCSAMPMHTAIQRGDTLRALQMIQEARSVEIMTVTGATPLQLAAAHGRLGIVRALLARGARIDRVTPKFGTALHQAAIGDRPEVVRVLLAHGAQVDARTPEGATPLHEAAVRGRSAAAAALLEGGADPNAARKNGFTPLCAAAIQEADKDCLPIVTMLLRHGADPRRATDKGWTALHIAVEEGDAAVARALISGGADLQAPGGAGRTPLEYAAQRQAADVIRILLDAGAIPQRNEALLDLTGATHRLKADWHLDRGEPALAIEQLRLAADCFEEQSGRLKGRSPARGGARRDYAEYWRNVMMDYAWARRDGGLFGGMYALGLNASGSGQRAAAERRAEELASEASKLRARAQRLEAGAVGPAQLARAQDRQESDSETPVSQGGGAALDSLRALTAVNTARVEKLLGYVVGTTTLDDFAADGWNADEPYAGRLGIVGILYVPDVSGDQSVDIVLGFTYELPGAGETSASDVIMNFQRSALGSSLDALKRGDASIRMSVEPMMAPTSRKPMTRAEWERQKAAHALRPFFESSVTVRFRKRVLAGLDLSGLRYVDVMGIEAARTVTCRCRIARPWLETRARTSTATPRPDPERILGMFAARGLDTVTLRYRLPDAAHPNGWGEVAGGELPALLVSDDLVSLKAMAGAKGPVMSAMYLREPGTLLLDLDLGDAQEKSVGYECERMN